jgi:hypothetical protein
MNPVFSGGSGISENRPTPYLATIEAMTEIIIYHTAKLT